MRARASAARSEQQDAAHQGGRARHATCSGQDQHATASDRGRHATANGRGQCVTATGAYRCATRAARRPPAPPLSERDRDATPDARGATASRRGAIQGARDATASAVPSEYGSARRARGSATAPAGAMALFWCLPCVSASSTCPVPTCPPAWVPASQGAHDPRSARAARRSGALRAGRRAPQGSSARCVCVSWCWYAARSRGVCAVRPADPKGPEAGTGGGWYPWYLCVPTPSRDPGQQGVHDRGYHQMDLARDCRRLQHLRCLQCALRWPCAGFC